MELLFVTVIGAGIGLIVRYVLPSRGTYGVLLVPAISAAATAITWVALLWAGQTFDGTYLGGQPRCSRRRGNRRRRHSAPPARRRGCPPVRPALRR